MTRRVFLDFYSRYKQCALERYPSAKKYFENTSWKFAVSNEIVLLPENLKQQIESVVSAFFILKKNKNYQNSFKEKQAFPLQHSQDSVLMAYDFHINKEGELKLIEVNTNASGFLISHLISEVHGWNESAVLNSLKDSFEAEWKKYKKTGETLQNILIADENPLEQKMLIEFLMYKDFFRSFGWKASIHDSQTLKLNAKKQVVDSHQNPVDFIYNRTTDFYFEIHPELMQAYLRNSCCFSPHPADYHLLANKKRLCEWPVQDLSSFLTPDLKQSVKNILLDSWILDSSSQERAWEERKSYFFKPLASHGGRQVYRGKGLTRTRFEKIIKEPFLFQKSCPPRHFTDQKGDKWKFDIRVFAYEDRVQQVVARLYKGQVTNFSSLGGGFTPVRFSPSFTFDS